MSYNQTVSLVLETLRLRRNRVNEPHPTLCSSCSRLTPQTTLLIDGHHIHDNLSSLIHSSQSCRLCRLLQSLLWNLIDRAQAKPIWSTEAIKRGGTSISLRAPGKVWSSEAMKTPGTTIYLQAQSSPGRIWLHSLGLHLREMTWYAEPSK